jgi:hypothetical protein
MRLRRRAAEKVRKRWPSRAAKMSIAGSNEELSIALERCQAFVCHCNRPFGQKHPVINPVINSVF